MISGILHVIGKGWRRKDAPREIQGPYTTLDNWRMPEQGRRVPGVFEELTSKAGGTETSMVDSTRLKAHQTACSMQERDCPIIASARPARPKFEAARSMRYLRRPAAMRIGTGPESDCKGAREMFSDRTTGTRPDC